jgi:DNA polymerase-3 subunit alpha
MLGQFVTDHPLLGIEGQLAAQTTCAIPDLDDRDDGELVVLGGIIGSLARKFTKRGEPYAQFRLEGLTGGVEVVAFPSVFEAVPELIQADRIVLVAGRIDRRGRELQIRATEVKEPTLSAGSAREADVLVVDLPAAVCSPGVLAKLRTLLEGSPGDVPVRLRFLSSQGVQPLSLGAFTVSSQGSLLDELRHLLGPAAARLEHEPV